MLGNRLEAAPRILIRKATAPKLPPLGVTDRAIRDALRFAVQRIKDATVRAEVTRALDRGDVQGAVDAIRWGEGEAFLASALPRAYRSAYELAGERAVTRLQLGGSFDIVNERAVRFVRERSAALIREWGDSSQAAVRALIERAFQDGIPARALGRLIVESGIGLTERQAVAVERFRVRLEDNDDLDLTQAQVDARTDRYARELLRQRGEVIARTEVILGSREGEQESWRQAGEQGFLDLSVAVQEWSAVLDSRTDEDCAELDGTTAKLGEPFPGGSLGPPLHPMCRCGLLLLPDGPR